jgi:pimeloyl-ACP methyl ester carboxylesterase
MLMPEISEDFFFFTDPVSGMQLYGCLYLPGGKDHSTGVLVAPPIGRERLRVYRELACSSRTLAAAGYPTLRFDYRGEGESDGLFQQSTLSSRVDDLVAAAEELRRRSGCSTICLLGVREGALLALRALDRIPAERLIFCEPTCNPKGHVRTLIRTNILSLKHYYGEERSSAQVRARLGEGEPVSVYGFQLGGELVEELERCDPGPALKAYSGQSALIYFAPKQVPPKKPLQAWQAGLDTAGSCETICAVLNFSWATKKLWDARLSAFDEAMTTWLQRTEAL